MWLLPSLGRPERAQRVAEAARDTKITLRLHKGDPRLKDYLRIEWPSKWKVVVGPRLSLTETLNEAFRENPRERQYGFLADDTIPSPSDWSQRLQTVAGRDFVAYPDDGLHGEKLCTHFLIGGDLMRSVGFWCLPGLKHNFLDTVWYVMGSKLGVLRYVPEVKFEHLHPLAGKAEQDETYKIGQGWYEKDKKVFERWVTESGTPGDN